MLKPDSPDDEQIASQPHNLGNIPWHCTPPDKASLHDGIHETQQQGFVFNGLLVDTSFHNEDIFYYRDKMKRDSFISHAKKKMGTLKNGNTVNQTEPQAVIKASRLIPLMRGESDISPTPSLYCKRSNVFSFKHNANRVVKVKCLSLSQANFRFCSKDSRCVSFTVSAPNKVFLIRDRNTKLCFQKSSSLPSPGTNCGFILGISFQ